MKKNFSKSALFITLENEKIILIVNKNKSNIELNSS
jgi:hypothetical protein